MCVLSIKMPIRKKSRNLFNDPRMCVYDGYYFEFEYDHRMRQFCKRIINYTIYGCVFFKSASLLHKFGVLNNFYVFSDAF